MMSSIDDETYTNDLDIDTGDDLLSIGTVAELTGVGVPSLRAWETRHGFPRPSRSEGTHRRYTADDVDAIRRVVEARRAGYSLEAAIASAGTGADRRPRSIYSAVRQRWPELPTRTISRRTMLAISRAVEDECCARAARPLLIAAFQTEAAYATARSRWRELSRTADHALVLAAFERTTTPRTGPTEVAIGSDSPMIREWAVICEAPGASACLIGWEQPDRRRRSRRPFEALWSVNPAVVRVAAQAALTLTAERAPDLRLPLADDRRQADPIEPDRLVALTDRIVANLDEALERRP